MLSGPRDLIWVVHATGVDQSDNSRLWKATPSPFHAVLTEKSHNTALQSSAQSPAHTMATEKSDNSGQQRSTQSAVHAVTSKKTDNSDQQSSDQSPVYAVVPEKSAYISFTINFVEFWEVYFFKDLSFNFKHIYLCSCEFLLQCKGSYMSLWTTSEFLAQSTA